MRVTPQNSGAQKIGMVEIKKVNTYVGLHIVQSPSINIIRLPQFQMKLE